MTWHIITKQHETNSPHLVAPITDSDDGGDDYDDHGDYDDYDEYGDYFVYDDNSPDCFVPITLL